MQVRIAEYERYNVYNAMYVMYVRVIIKVTQWLRDHLDGRVA